MITHLIASIALLTGTMTDFHRREVPYWVTSSLIGAAFIIAILQTTIAQSWTPLLESIVGFAVAWVFGATMYYTGQWGGADTTLLMGLGALFGLPLAWQTSFFAIFMIVLLFAGAVYGVAYLFFLVIVKRKLLFPLIHESLSNTQVQKIRKIALIVLPLLALLAIVYTTVWTFLLAFIPIVAYFTYLLFLIVKTVENSVFIKKILVEDLVPGDWICEDVTKKKETLIKCEELKTGLEKEHIVLLKEQDIKEVVVKEGIPFVPSFLLAYVVVLLFEEQIAAYLQIFV